MRWRLAAASAGLTLAILLVFAAMIGHLAGQRVRSDFNRELQEAVGRLAKEVRVQDTLTGAVITDKPNLDDFVKPNDASVRIFDPQGLLLDQSKGAPNLGPPDLGIRDEGPLRVATAALQSASTGRIAAYVQYSRSEVHVESTIQRLWLFIAAGVLGGTLLALLAGLAVADRAMRPISSLTNTARKIAATRDPSQRMPQQKVDDEVGQLARTLDDMLRSLDAARTEREVTMQKQREFVADASHELRTPLTSVLANLELLQASLRPTDRSDDVEIVDSAVRSSQRMSRLVADLLLLARADAGKVRERSVCDVADVAASAAREVTPAVAGRDFEVHADNAVTLEGNQEELHRMVINLLDNAARYTPPGSRIELRVDETSDTVTIEVSDEGPGISEDQRDQIFERFVQGPKPADMAPGAGTGLGLAIVRAIARSHGGDVAVDESRFGGARFRVTLPRDYADVAR